MPSSHERECRPPFACAPSLGSTLPLATKLSRMSQSKEVRYTARSITPPTDRNGTSKSPPPRRRSPSRSPPPKRSVSRSPRPRSPKRHSTSRSPPPRRRGRSRSRSRDRSRSRSEDDRNPGNNLYVTGLSTRVTEDDLEKFFSKEGKVKNCHVVLDPRTKESRGFAFVTMDTVEDARRCIKYLHRTVLEGRLVTVEKAKRTRERTPTPGKYCGRRGVLRGALGAHHLTVLAEGSDPAQGSAEGRGPGQGIEGSDPAQGSAEGRGPGQGIEGSDPAQGTAEGIGLVQGIAEGIAHAQGIARAAHHMKEILSEGVWIGPGHQPAMGTTRQTSKPLPCDKLLFF
ncbi:hypothetical protein ACP70R_015927 [Stipagrostis hirtigluma subsp. patula]